MDLKTFFVPLILQWCLPIPVEMVIFKFTNLECLIYDKSFAVTKHCYLKAEARDRVSLNAHIRMLQLPVNNIKIHAQFFRKSFDYRPYLYNETYDLCAFLRNKKKFPFWEIVFNAIGNHSNVNHTCPYNHDIIIDRYILTAAALKYVPFAQAEYMLTFQVYIHNDLKGRTRLYMSLTN